MKPSETYTVEQFIQLGKTISVTYEKYSFKNILSNGTEISVHNTVNDYMRDLKEASVLVKFNNEEYRRYLYKPRVLCHEVYGNQDVYYVILLLNGIIDEKEFDFHTLYMPPVDILNSYMSAIYNAEYKYIKEYNSKHGTA